MILQDIFPIVTVFIFLFIVIAIPVYIVLSSSKLAMKEDLNRNIRAFAILDCIFGMIGIAPLVYGLYSKGVDYIQSAKPLLYLFFVIGVIFWIAGLGFLYRKNWARILHYPLGVVVGFGTVIGFIYLIFSWRFISKPEVRKLFK